MIENDKEIKKLQEENERLKNFFKPFVKKFREAALHEYWWCPFCNKEVIITYDGKCPECGMNMEDIYPSIDWINEATNLVEDSAPILSNNKNTLVTVDVIKLKEDLNSKLIVVKFQELDGPTRIMRCTTSPSWIRRFYEKNNMVYEETSESNRETSESTILVYDIDKEDWQPFHWDKVIAYREITHDEFFDIILRTIKYYI